MFCPCVGSRTVAQRAAAARWAGLLLLQGLNELGSLGCHNWRMTDQIGVSGMSVILPCCSYIVLLTGLLLCLWLVVLSGPF